MSKDWTKEELARASEVMKANGFMSLEEFCEALDRCDKLAYGIDHEELEHRKNDPEIRKRIIAILDGGEVR